MSWLVICLIVFVISFYLGLALPYWYTIYYKQKLTKKYAYDVMDEKNLCKGPHDWMQAMFEENGAYVTLNTCKKCGLVSGRDYMIDKETIHRVIENDKLVKQEKQVQNEFIDQEEKEIKEYLKEELAGGLDWKKVMRVYFLGQTSYKQYLLFKMMKAEEAEKQRSTK